MNSTFHMFPFFVLKYCKKDEEHNFFKINKENYIKLICGLENNDGDNEGGSSMSIKTESEIKKSKPKKSISLKM